MGLGEGLERRRFLASMAVLGVPLAGRGQPGVLALQAARAADHFPQNDPVRVQAVVGASHGDLDRVRALVGEQPALAKASWDWGFGDWETALGAASHTGRREIAQYLIGHGARPTLFSAAMLGQVDTVRAFLDGDPTLHRLHGPHGISLVRHARAGGVEAEPVLELLLGRFGPDEIPFGVAADPALEARYGGRYRFGDDPAREMAVGLRSGWLMAGAGTQPSGRILKVEPDVYHPTGAPAVRFRFHVVDGTAVRMTIEDGPLRVSGRRVGDLQAGPDRPTRPGPERAG